MDRAAGGGVRSILITAAFHLRRYSLSIRNAHI